MWQHRVTWRLHNDATVLCVISLRTRAIYEQVGAFFFVLTIPTAAILGVTQRLQDVL